jgi:hypothetical protein
MKALQRINPTYTLDNLPQIKSNSFIHGDIIGYSGSIFRRKITGPLKIYWHYAIFYGVDFHERLLFIENNRDGVECVTWDDFVMNEKWELHHTEPNLTRFSDIMKRAKEKVKYEYQGSENNCEHFVNYCVFGREESEQANNTKKVADAFWTIAEMNLLKGPGGDDPVLAEAMNDFREVFNLKRNIPKFGEKLDKRIEDILKTKEGKNPI